PRTSPSARSTRGAASSCSASSSSATSRASSLTSMSGGSGGEELDILLLPANPYRLPLASAQRRVVISGDFHQQPLAPRREVELDEVAEELHEHDLARSGVERARCAAGGDPSRRSTNRDEGGRADGARVAGRLDAGANAVLVLDDQPAARVLDDLALDDVVVAHEARDELRGRLGGDRQRIGHLLDPR